MGLKKFDYKMNESKKAPIIIAVVIIMILLIGVTVYMTHAKYKITNSYNVLKGRVIDFSTIEEGTLAYSILSNYTGINTLSETEEANVILEIDATEYAHNIIATDNQNVSIESIYYGTEYTYDETTGSYTLGGTLVLATLEECRSGTKTCGKYTLNNSDSSYSDAKIYEVIDFQTSGEYVTTNTIKYTNEFGKGTLANETSLNKTQDDLGISYYFRGNAVNNYVQFGLYEEDTTLTVYDYSSNTEKTIEVKAGTPMYWRIVRINGDGTVRLVYDGVEKAVNGVAHTATIAHTAYNTNSDNAKYVGYTYEGTNEAGETVQVDSPIKGIVDTWYDTHLETTYGSYIADGIFCNDRQDDNNDNYFAAYDRLYTNKTPSVKCTNKADRYTVDDTTNGNGLLSNPVGLLTADEAALAGAVAHNSNTTYYLYSTEMYWTSAANFFNNTYVSLWFINSDGGLHSGTVDSSDLGVRPVVNLKADVAFTGDGSFETPYVITTN